MADSEGAVAVTIEGTIVTKREKSWVGKWDGGRIAIPKNGRSVGTWSVAGKGTRWSSLLPRVRDERSVLARFAAVKSDAAGSMVRTAAVVGWGGTIRISLVDDYFNER
jgi:hypothetical protein